MLMNNILELQQMLGRLEDELDHIRMLLEKFLQNMNGAMIPLFSQHNQ